MEQWCCYRGNTQHTGSLCKKPASKGELNWTYDTEGKISYPPALVDNVLYVPSEKDLFAINSSDGSLIWKYSATSNITSPVLADKSVYFASENGIIYSINIEDGKERWVLKTGSAIIISPALFDGALYIGTTARDFYRIDTSEGKIIWTFKTEEGIYSSPVVFGGMVFTGAGRRFYAIDINKGTERWSYKTKGTINSSPAISSGVIYLSAGYVYAMDVLNGARKWITEIEGDEVTGTPVMVGNSIFVVSKNYMAELGRTAAILYCIDGMLGNRLWAFFAWDKLTSPAVVDNFIYTGAGDGTVHAIDSMNGMELWSLSTDTKGFSSPAAGNGSLYLGGNDGKVYSIS